MNNSFEVVLANLNTSLRNAAVRGYGDVPHCYIRADELAALIQCAHVCNYYGGDNDGMATRARRALEACDHE